MICCLFTSDVYPPSVIRPWMQWKIVACKLQFYLHRYFKLCPQMANIDTFSKGTMCIFVIFFLNFYRFDSLIHINWLVWMESKVWKKYPMKICYTFQIFVLIQTFYKYFFNVVEKESNKSKFWKTELKKTKLTKLATLLKKCFAQLFANSQISATQCCRILRQSGINSKFYWLN